ncbi:MAG: hypothetical protein Q8K02_13360 [Flavobacterium sp.]|nr:hypothetical protein [Flavobacterium sp.]
MKFEIPFKEEIYKKQTSLNLSLTWEKILKKNKKNLIIYIFFISIGFLTIYGGGNIGVIFIIIGLFGLLECYRINTAYQNYKKTYLKLIENEIKGQLESNEKSVWEFNDDYFSYKDYKYEAKIKWNAFKNYRIIEDNIFLDLNVGNQSSYILSKEEIGNDSFENIIELIHTKINRTSH